MIVLGPIDEQGPYLTEWDYVLLRRKLDQLLSARRIRKRQVLKPLHAGTSEEWFEDVETGEIYCLVPPAERITPRWEKVDPFSLFGDVSSIEQ
jgi:hypothetical protein